MPITLGDTSITSSTGNVGVAGTGSLVLPAGTTGQRPGTPSDGMLRFNTTSSSLEFYGNSNWNTASISGVPISSISPSWQYLPTVNTSVSATTFNDSNYWGAYFAVPTAGNGETQLAGYEYPLVGKFNTRSTFNNDAIFQLYGFGGGSATGFFDADTFFQMGVVWVAPPYASGQTNSFHATSALGAGNGVYAVGKGYGTGTWSFYNGGASNNSASQGSTNRESFQTVSWTGQNITFVVKRDTDFSNARKIAMYIGDTQIYKWTQVIPVGTTYVGIYIGNGYGSSSSTIWSRDRPRFRYADYSSTPIQMI